MAARRDYYVLFSGRTKLVGHRSGVSASWQLRFPQFLASLNIKRAEERIKSASDKNQSPCRDNRASECDRSRWQWRLLPAKVLHRAERDLPAKLAVGHIHRGQHTPRRRDTG